MEKQCSLCVPFTLTVKAFRSDKTASRLAAALVAICGDIDSIRTVEKDDIVMIREYRLVARCHGHKEQIIRALDVVPGIEIVDVFDGTAEVVEFESLALATSGPLQPF